MIKTSRTTRLATSFVVIILATCGWALTAGDSSVGAQDAQLVTGTPRPVDDDMHHFMEYVFEPNYKRLKAALADEPRDKQAWKAIKGDALTLAECTNLLLLRVPEDDADQWRKLSVAVRTDGGELYQAARKLDYTSARQAYLNMLNQCNACHQQFADGEHQLQP